jgi:hypothetical protein
MECVSIIIATILHAFVQTIYSWVLIVTICLMRSPKDGLRYRIFRNRERIVPKVIHTKETIFSWLGAQDTKICIVCV